MLDMFSAVRIPLTALLFVLGLIVGSFCNCAAWRIVRNEDFVRGRSHCAVCGRTLSARELIPLVSYLIQGGKSRCCGERLSLRYPLTELLMAVVFTGLLWQYRLRWDLPLLMALSALLLMIALIDLETGLIPDVLILLGIGNFIILACLRGGSVWASLWRGLCSGLAISVPILLLSLLMDRVLKKESMGGGDIKLYFMTGLYFSVGGSIFLVLLSCIFGILFSLIFRGVRIADADNPQAFPFGPSIAAAAICALFIAEPVVLFYMGLF